MSTLLPRPASVARWYDQPAQLAETDAYTWIARGANFVVALTRPQAGTRLVRHAQADEYMVLLTDSGATITAGGVTIEASAESVTIVPPGDSQVLLHGSGEVVRLFSGQAQDLLALAANAGDYAEPTPEVAPLVPWPTPADGFRLRTYRLAEHIQPDSNMRIFRSTNLMLNVMTPRMVARDVRKLSPHSHADFEQGSLALTGQWMHHMRYPWGADLGAWRDDEHIEIGSPSIAVIPPKAIHTSRNLNDGGAWLLDIFAPPRMDFAGKPGKVANERDYPLPPA